MLNMCRLLHSKNRAQLRHLDKNEVERKGKNIYKYTKKFVVLVGLYIPRGLLSLRRWSGGSCLLLLFLSPHRV